MRSSNDINNVEFQKAMGGYKPSDVQNYLDEVAEDYRTLQRKIAELETKNAAQAKEIAELKAEQISVHTLLINAQKLADKTVEDAKAEAVRIVNDAHAAVNEIMGEAETRVAVAKQQAENIKKNSDLEMEKLLSKAVVKSENMITAAHDSVARQQLLFDKLKVEAATFKKELIGIYKKQLEILNTMPEEVPFDAQRAADAMAFETDQTPNFKEMAVNTMADTTQETQKTPEAEPAPVEEVPVAPVEEPEIPEIEPVQEPEEELVVETNAVETEDAEQQSFLDFEDEPAQEQPEPVKKENKEPLKKSSFFGKLNFSEEEEDEDFEPRDLFGRQK